MLEVWSKSRIARNWKAIHLFFVQIDYKLSFVKGVTSELVFAIITKLFYDDERMA